MVGCAAGALLVAGAPVRAQSINETPSTDFAIERDRVDGTVTVISSGGNSRVSIGEVAAPYPADASAIVGAVTVQNGGAGDAIVTVGSVHGAGDGNGRLQGVNVSTTSGALTLDSGSVVTRKGSGIVTRTTTGATSIRSKTVSALGSLGIDARSTSGAITVESGAVTSEETAIFVETDGAIDVTTGDVEVLSYNGLDLYGGTGNINVDAGDVTVGVAGNQGIWAQTTSGNIDISAGTVTTAATSINNGYTSDGVFGYSAGEGSVTISVDKVAVQGPFSNAIGGVGSEVNIISGDASTAGQEVATIYGFSRKGDTTIMAGTTSATGQFAYAIEGHAATGDTVIVSKAASAAHGVAIWGDAAGRVTVESGAATSAGDGFSAILATGGSGVLVNAAATISAGDTYTDSNGATYRADAIFAHAASGAVTVNAGDVTATGASSDGIHIVANGLDGAATVDVTGTVSAASGTGLNVNSGGAIDIASHVVNSEAGNGILVTGGDGQVSLAADTVTIGAAGNQGIFVESAGGDISIDAGTVTTAATVLNNGFTSDGVFGYSAGDGAVTISVDTVAVNGPYSNAIGGVGGGEINITSGTASTTGDHVATIYGYSRHADTTITAGTTTATGTDVGAIVAHAVEGDVTITSKQASSTGGFALQGYAGGTVTIDIGSATGAGDGAGAILAVGGQGVVVTVADAKSSGDNFTDANGNEWRADAVQAIATNGTATVNVGNATATGAGADAVRVLANGTGGAATVNVTGTVSSASGHGVFIDPPGSTTVTLAAGASVTGALGGLSVESGTGNSIVNAGTIASSSDVAAIVALGATQLDNSGTISSMGGVAVALDATDDMVTLRSGSSVKGVIVGGGGSDSARLAGSSDVASAAQTLARFQDFSSLDVVSGYWQGAGAASAFNAVTIASPATLEVAGLESGLSGVSAPSISIDGTLAVVTATGEESSLGTTLLTGTGRFSVQGAGSLAITADQTAFAGTTEVGGTLVLSSELGGDLVTTAGGTFVLADGAMFVGDVTNDGTFVYDRTGSYSLAGDFSGSGTLVKNGSGTLAFDGVYDFTGTTTIVGGSLRFAEGIASGAELDLAGGGSLDLSGQQNSVAELSGTSADSSIVIDDGALTVAQNSGSVFAGSITGTGSLTKTGAGNLNLTGVNSYTGPTTVTGGTLSVNGSITSNVGVSGGGKLGGNGVVGNVAAANGGIVGPGNSIGRLNVAGDIAFDKGSIHEVEANAAGAADLIVATGTATIDGAVMQVIAEPGDYARLTDYTVLVAEGGIEGTFTDVTTDMAFLTPLLGYTPTAVTLTLARNDVGFATLAQTGNQAAVATAVQALGMSSDLYRTVLTQSRSGAVQAFSALSGEAEAGIGTHLVDENRDIRSAIAGRSVLAGDGPGVWLHAIGSWSESRPDNGAAKLSSDRRGTIGGLDFGSGRLHMGVLAGYLEGDVEARRVNSEADTETKLAGAYAALSSGPFTVEVGATYAWHDLDTQRVISFPGFDGVATGTTDGQSAQLFGEASYKLVRGAFALEPVIGLAHVMTSIDGFEETGTEAALRFAEGDRNATFASATLRAGGDVDMGGGNRFQPHFSAGYMHGWGDLDGRARASFIGADAVFTMVGAGIGRDTLILGGGLDLVVDESLRIGASYSATLSNDWASRSARLTMGLRF